MVVTTLTGLRGLCLSIVVSGFLAPVSVLAVAGSQLLSGDFFLSLSPGLGQPSFVTWSCPLCLPQGCLEASLL